MTAAWSSLDSDLTRRTLAVVMAGGNGTRLGALTREDSKPALHFGGQYRNIDFPLSNCVNSGVRRIAVATQYKAHSLIQHLMRGWNFLSPEIGEHVELWPAQQRRGERWYAGTADAIRQNLDLIEAHAPDYLLILAGDHVYKMDYRPMLYEHAASGADVTVGCVEVPLAHAREFGVMETDDRGHVLSFQEKPRVPRASPPGSNVALASMGIYVFGWRFLARCLGAEGTGALHDFGHDVLPALIRKARVLAYAFQDPVRGGPAYWRDVGTLDSYWRAHMDLLDDPPALDLADPEWPIRTYCACPAPVTFRASGSASRSIVSSGCTIGGFVELSVMSPDCSVGAGARVERSVLLPNVEIGRGCRVSRAVVAGGCRVPDGLDLDPEILAAAGVQESGAGDGIALITAEVVDQLVAGGEGRKVAVGG